MSDPRADRDAYLARVSARLRLPPDHERDVLEELEGHLTESAASLVEEGLPAELAERESIARLGDPGRARRRRLRRARQSRRRLLATAGAGVNAAIGGFFWGYILASALSSVAAVLAAVAVSTVLGWLGLTTSGWSNSAQSFAIPIALFVPGVVAYRMVTAIAGRSARRAETLRRPFALLGGGLLAVVAAFLVRAELDPVRVVSHLVDPHRFCDRGHSWGAKTGKTAPAPYAGAGVGSWRLSWSPRRSSSRSASPAPGPTQPARASVLSCRWVNPWTANNSAKGGSTSRARTRSGSSISRSTRSRSTCSMAGATSGWRSGRRSTSTPSTSTLRQSVPRPSRR